MIVDVDRRKLYFFNHKITVKSHLFRFCVPFCLISNEQNWDSQRIDYFTKFKYRILNGVSSSVYLKKIILLLYYFAVSGMRTIEEFEKFLFIMVYSSYSACGREII